MLKKGNVSGLTSSLPILTVAKQTTLSFIYPWLSGLTQEQVTWADHYCSINYQCEMFSNNPCICFPENNLAIAALDRHPTTLTILCMPTGCIHCTVEGLKSTGHLWIDGREGRDRAAIILHSRCDPTPNLAGLGQWSREEGYGKVMRIEARVEWRRADLLCARQWRVGLGKIQRLALREMWQHNTESEAANHW